MLYNQKSKETEEVRDFVRCQIGSCHGGAMAVAGKSNVCREHYDNFYTSEALKWNSTMGLNTVDKRKEYISNKIRGVIKSIKL